MQYALIKGGQVCNVIVAEPGFVALIAPQWDHIEPLDTTQEQGAGIGWAWRNGKFVPPSASSGPARRQIAVFAFRRRFTKAERDAIEWAAVDRADQPEAVRKQAASLRASLADQASASYIDLDDAETIAGVKALVDFGLLTLNRAAAILSAPVEPEELP